MLFAALVLSAGAGNGSVWAHETTVEDASPEATVPATPEPELVARAWALVDERSGEYLAGKSSSQRLSMASTTKIMVALLAFEDARLEEEVTVSKKAASFARQIYSNIGLREGDVLNVRELLRATLISSGDDAAYALAEHLGDGSVERFVEKMNRKADALALDDTRFQNPTGLDVRGHYSSARDLAKLTREAFEYPEFREMVGTAGSIISTQNREIRLTNTNELLFIYPPATGVKTGTTPAAGPSLVASAAAGNESYIVVVLDAGEDRYAAAIRALEYGFGAYDRIDVVKKGKRYAEAEVPFRRGETVNLVAGERVSALVGENSDVEREATVMEDLPDSAEPGTRLGTVFAKVDGERVGQSPLVAGRGYDEASLWEMLWYTLEGIFE